MGQYYMIVNEQKKEVITFQYSKAAEIFFNEDDLGRLLMILYYDKSCLGQCFTDLPIPKTNKYVGRWLGTSFVFVGDYSDTGLYEKAETFKDITKPLTELMFKTFEKFKEENK
jgi:hypothetical protein